MAPATRRPQGPQVAPFAAMSASYFAHIGFFGPYLPLWLQHLGLPILVISLLTAVQPLTRIFAPYLWGMVSDRTGERIRLLRWSAFVAFLGSAGLWWNGGPWWLGLVLLVVFTHTSSMMALTEAAMSHLVAGDWGRYGRIRLWGSLGFMVMVFVAGWWFDHFGMDHFQAWTTLTLAAVLGCALWLPDAREKPAGAQVVHEPVAPVLRLPVVRWFFASLFFHVMAHVTIHAFFSLYLDAQGYSKAIIGALWAVSVVIEIGWFFWQGRIMNRLTLPGWLVLCGATTVVRFVITSAFPGWLAALFVAQSLHAVTFAAHHTASIAIITRYFPGSLRGRGQALFTIVGYGLSGVVGVVAGGWFVSRFGYQVLYGAAAVLGLLATLCAWRVHRLARTAP